MASSISFEMPCRTIKSFAGEVPLNVQDPMNGEVLYICDSRVSIFMRFDIYFCIYL